MTVASFLKQGKKARCHGDGGGRLNSTQKKMRNDSIWEVGRGQGVGLALGHASMHVMRQAHVELVFCS